MPCALFNPETHTWSSADELNYRKQYHSVAVLLPNGKVMATGGSNYGGGSNVIEVYSPPDMFNADGSLAVRPAIDALPGTVHHGDTFQVESANAANIARMVLVRPMAVTHQTDTAQRVLPMSFTVTGTSICERSCAMTASSLAASISPFLTVPWRVLPFQLKIGISISPLYWRINSLLIAHDTQRRSDVFRNADPFSDR